MLAYRHLERLGTSQKKKERLGTIMLHEQYQLPFFLNNIIYLEIYIDYYFFNRFSNFNNMMLSID